MKTLQDYIFEHLKISKNFDFSYKQANDYYQNQIVNESLYRSCSSQEVICFLSKKYNIDISDFGLVNSHYDNAVIVVPEEKLYKDKQSGQLEETLLKLGYYIGYIIDGNYFIEPIYSENITDIIQDDCSGKIYKLVDASLWNKIQKSGGLYPDKDTIYEKVREKIKDKKISKLDKSRLQKFLSKIPDIRLNRFAQRDKSYRQYFSRLYFFAGADKNSIKRSLNYLIKSFADSGNNISNCVVLEIDISKYNVNCYIDTMYDIDYDSEHWWFLYVNAFFPLEIIKAHKIEKLIKELF